MKIKYEYLHEVYLKQVKLIAQDEHFYSIKNAEQYVLSSYGRLFRLMDGNHHKMVEQTFYKGEEAYMIAFDGATKETPIIISQLIANVFFPNEQIFRLYNPCLNGTKHEYRWKVENLHIIRTKEQLAEAFLAKMEGNTVQTDSDLKNHILSGGWNLPKGANYIEKLHTIQAGIHTRATNEKYKQLHPQYSETTISQEWLDNPAKLKQYWLDVIYYHPEKLVADKDIMGFGHTNHYAEGLVVPVPVYINSIFVKSTSEFGYCISQHKRKDGTIYYKIPQSAYIFEGKREKDIICDNYYEALIAGRKRKADYIRKVVGKERALGYMPEYILEAMEQWADLCEAGHIKIWEPSEDVIKEQMKV